MSKDFQERGGKQKARQLLRLNSREAAQLYMEIEDSVVDGIGWLSEQKILELAGDGWKEKLGKMCLDIRPKDVPEGNRGLTPLDADPLRYIAESPAEAQEVSLFLSRRFGGALKARDFMEGRLRSPSQDQNIICESGFMEKFLGPLWAERLDAAGIPCTTSKDGSGLQALMNIEQLLNFAREELDKAVEIETRNPTSRQYGRGKRPFPEPT